jgi:putative ABC transport system permease protein
MSGTTLAERLYRLLLRCYPGEFRDDYEREMMLAFRERLSHDRGVGLGAVLRLWMHLLADSIVRAPREHADVFRQDVGYTFRSLRRAPAFAFTAVATLALGVGANTAIFSVVHAVALRPLPYEASDRLIRIWERHDSLAPEGFAVSLPNYASWRERVRTLEIAAWRSGSVTLQGKGEPVRVPAVALTPDYFRLLGVKPIVGRVLVAEDERTSGGNVAVIRDSLWRSYFGSDPGVVGTAVTIAGQSHTIVGVIAETSVPMTAEYYTPLRFDVSKEDRSNHIGNVLGRVKDGFTIAQVTQELEAVAK